MTAPPPPPSSSGFRALENQYFEEARRLGEEERKRRLLAIRPDQRTSQNRQNDESGKNSGSSGRITPGGLFGSVNGLSSVLTALTSTRNVFIQRAGNEFVDKFFYLECRFDLLNTTDERIFFAGETIQALKSSEEESGCCGCFHCRVVTPPFDVSVVSCEGGGVLNVTSSKSSSAATISDCRNVLGKIAMRREFSLCFGFLTTYWVKDKSDEPTFRIGPTIAAAGREMEFNVFTVNMKELIGRMGRKWRPNEVPPHALWSTAYGVSFPATASIETKALLLGSLIAIVAQDGFRDLGAYQQRGY